jgi:multiple sugar transport system permease protein
LRAPRLSLTRRRSRPRTGGTPALPPALRYPLLGAYLLFLLFPIYWLVVTSLEGSEEPLSGSARDFVPNDASLELYGAIRVEETTIYDSLIIAGLAAIAATLVGAAAAYGLVQTRRAAAIVGLLALRALPPVGLALPLFLIADDVGLRDTHLGLILVYATFGLPLTILVAYAVFRQLPPDVGEAALLDGCTQWQRLRHVVVPLARPGLAAALTLAFLYAWTDFLFALVLTSEDVRTVPIAIGNLTRGFGGPGSLSPWISTLSVVTGLLPALLAAAVLYLALRRRVSLETSGE